VVAWEVLALDDYRTPAIVRVKTERWSLQEVLVKEEDHVVVCIVDQTKWADTTGFESEVFEHTLGASKGEFARGVLACGEKCSFKALLQVVDSQVMLAVKAYEVVLGTLVIAHEDIFAMHAAIVLPPAFGLLDGLTLRVVVAFKRYLMLSEVC
jgi:hypothetical protein